MNFFVDILILKKEENITFWYIIFRYFKKGKSATEMQKICTVYGEGAVTECQKWFAKFQAGEFSLGNQCSMVRYTS